jgi:hypothetical protein
MAEADDSEGSRHRLDAGAAAAAESVRQKRQPRPPLALLASGIEPIPATFPAPHHHKTADLF